MASLDGSVVWVDSITLVNKPGAILHSSLGMDHPLLTCTWLSCCRCPHPPRSRLPFVLCSARSPGWIPQHPPCSSPIHPFRTVESPGTTRGRASSPPMGDLPGGNEKSRPHAPSGQCPPSTSFDSTRSRSMAGPKGGHWIPGGVARLQQWRI
eukprot:scaffold113_cov339-Pavlova_lutheri.AAC.30